MQAAHIFIKIVSAQRSLFIRMDTILQSLAKQTLQNKRTEIRTENYSTLCPFHLQYLCVLLAQFFSKYLNFKRVSSHFTLLKVQGGPFDFTTLYYTGRSKDLMYNL
jgi:hypothetical protein